MGEARPARGGLVRAFNVGRKGLGCGRHGKIRRWMGSQTEWWEVGADVGVVGEVSSAAAWWGVGRGRIRRWGGRRLRDLGVGGGVEGGEGEWSSSAMGRLGMRGGCRRQRDLGMMSAAWWARGYEGGRIGDWICGTNRPQSKARFSRFETVLKSTVNSCFLGRGCIFSIALMNAEWSGGVVIIAI